MKYLIGDKVLYMNNFYTYSDLKEGEIVYISGLFFKTYFIRQNYKNFANKVKKRDILKKI